MLLELSLEVPSAHTVSPYLHGNAPATLCRFLRTRHPAFRSLPLHALSSLQRWCAAILPTDVCHPIFVSLPLCTRALVARSVSTVTCRLLRETRRFTPTSLLWRDRAIALARCSLADVASVFAADVPVVTPLRSLRPLSRTRAGLNHRGRCLRRAVTRRRFFRPRNAFGRCRFERLLPCGKEPLLSRWLVSKLGHVGGTPPSVTEGLVSPLLARAHLRAPEVFQRG